jgi:2-polyprenyl-3-methyl-5-hydroxy-6-metoxy-1,4-benzoquinol methylase
MVSAWPVSELEEVNCCPVCADTRRAALYRDLSDRVFRVAPGEWTVWRCRACGAAYLNPRPTVASISLAYREYYTHDSAASVRVLPDAPNPLRRLKLSFANGRINGRLGYRRRPSSRLGAWLVPLLVRRDRELLGALRFVAKRKDGRLLDVGCGDGAYLTLMSDLGWEVAGVDPDPAGIAVAQQSGLDVHVGTLADAGFPDSYFDVVTLSHTIEHVHDPVALLRECRRVLSPGGELVVLTPNLASDGHRRFGADWLHLDPPRHLVIFTIGSLRRALAAAGFSQIDQLPVRLWGASARSSEALRSGTDALHPPRLRPRLRVVAAFANLRSLRDPACAEEVALRAS